MNRSEIINKITIEILCDMDITTLNVWNNKKDLHGLYYYELVDKAVELAEISTDELSNKLKSKTETEQELITRLAIKVVSNIFYTTIHLWANFYLNEKYPEIFNFCPYNAVGKAIELAESISQKLLNNLEGKTEAEQELIKRITIQVIGDIHLTNFYSRGKYPKIYSVCLSNADDQAIELAECLVNELCDSRKSD